MKHLRSDLLSLVSKKFCHVSDNINGGKIILSDAQNTKMKVQLTEIPKNAVVLKCPNNLGKVFKQSICKNNSDHKTLQICDYFMIVNHYPLLELFFFELKETQAPDKLREASNQIKCSIPLLRYIVSGLEVHCGYRYQLPENIWKEHYVILFNQIKDKVSLHRRSALQWVPKTENLPEACAYVVNRPLSLSTIRAESDNAKKRAKTNP